MKNVLRRMVVVVATLALLAATVPLAPQEQLPPPAPLAPHELIESASSLMSALAETGAITKGQAQSLLVKLEDASQALWQANAGAAIRHLGAFQHQVEALAQGGQLGSKDATTLADYATQASNAIEQLAFNIPSVARVGNASCQQVACPQPLVLYVDGRQAHLAPDGSQARPFRSIAAALAAAEEEGACGVEIHLARGMYSGDILLTRHTRIIGDETRATTIRGSIIDEGGYDLDLRGITIASSPAPGGVVAQPCPANVDLSAVVVDGATRYGVRQDGGSLRMFATRVRATLAQSDDVYAGSGVRLTGGAKAVIGRSEIDGSGSVGLAISDPETRVYVAASLIGDSHVNPSFEDELPLLGLGFGGVEVRDGALLLMLISKVEDNEAFGVSVRSGGRAHLRYAEILGTASRRIGGLLVAGFNVFAENDATVEISRVTVTRGDLAGIGMKDSFVTGSASIVSFHPIGVVILSLPASDPAYDLNAATSCLNGVAFLHNDLNLDFAALPAPCGSGCPPPPPCHSVPTVCDWCGS